MQCGFLQLPNGSSSGTHDDRRAFPAERRRRHRNRTRVFIRPSTVVATMKAPTILDLRTVVCWIIVNSPLLLATGWDCPFSPVTGWNCPAGEPPTCFQWLTDRWTWDEAERRCALLGGHLPDLAHKVIIPSSSLFCWSLPTSCFCRSFLRAREISRDQSHRRGLPFATITAEFNHSVQVLVSVQRLC